MKVIQRLACVVMVVSMGLFSSGCIKNKVVIQVNKDGSGKIAVTRIFSKEAVVMIDAMMKQVAQQMAAMGGDVTMNSENAFFDEEGLKKEAAVYGSNVRYVSAREYNKDGARGSMALYEFDDINELQLASSTMSGDSAMSGMGGMGGGMPPQNTEDSVKFQFSGGDEAVLKILMPESLIKALEKDTADDLETDSAVEEITPEAKAQMMKMLMAGGNPMGLTGNESMEEVFTRMFKGMKITMAIEVEGTPVESSFEHKYPGKDNRFILFEMDMDKMLGSEQGKKVIKGLMAQGPGSKKMSKEESLTVFKGVPGFIIETAKESTLKFK